MAPSGHRCPPRAMSALRGKADAFSCSPTCPLMTQSGHHTQGSAGIGHDNEAESFKSPRCESTSLIPALADRRRVGMRPVTRPLRRGTDAPSGRSGRSGLPERPPLGGRRHQSRRVSLIRMSAMPLSERALPVCFEGESGHFRTRSPMSANDPKRTLNLCSTSCATGDPFGPPA
jgi:hypothetical protein